MMGYGFGYYTPILLLQAFCIYQAYKRNEAQKWYFIIIFFPLIGCLIYLYELYYSRERVADISEGIKNAINSNRQVELLEKEFEFNDSMTNRMNLADAYTDLGRYDEAIQLYQGGLKGLYENDPNVLQHMVRAFALNENYEEVISHASRIKEGSKQFKNSEERVLLGWSYLRTGNKEEAEHVLESMNHNYSNFFHRKELLKFYIETQQLDKAQALFDHLMNEYDHLERVTKRDQADVFREIKSLNAQIN